MVRECIRIIHRCRNSKIRAGDMVLTICLEIIKRLRHWFWFFHDIIISLRPLFPLKVDVCYPKTLLSTFNYSLIFFISEKLFGFDLITFHFFFEIFKTIKGPWVFVHSCYVFFLHNLFVHNIYVHTYSVLCVYTYRVLVFFFVFLNELCQSPVKNCFIPSPHYRTILSIRSKRYDQIRGTKSKTAHDIHNTSPHYIKLTHKWNSVYSVMFVFRIWY